MRLRSIVRIGDYFGYLMASHSSCKSLHSCLQLRLLPYLKDIANKGLLRIKKVNTILKALIHDFSQLPYQSFQLLVCGRLGKISQLILADYHELTKRIIS